MLIFDTIIIGAGVSGITASIYLKRANKKILLLEKSMIGGQINKTSIISHAGLRVHPLLRRQRR